MLQLWLLRTGGSSRCCRAYLLQHHGVHPIPPTPPLSLVFSLSFLFPTSSVCSVFSAFSLVCFPWGATNFVDGLSCVMQHIHHGAGCVWHTACPGLLWKPALQPTTCHGHPAQGEGKQGRKSKVVSRILSSSRKMLKEVCLYYITISSKMGAVRAGNSPLWLPFLSAARSRENE